MLPVFFGLAGHTLSADEHALFSACKPAGYILFARNIDTPDQVQRLCTQLRDIAGNAQLPILIDQEGGRVARMRPPHWQAYPPQAVFGRLYAQNPEAGLKAARLNAQLLGYDLSACAVTVNCLPLLDVPQADAHEIISDRAFSAQPEAVARLGRAVLEGLTSQGVVGVIKHIPGHGRAAVDSHLALPVVTAGDALLAQDLMPFQALNDAPMAMTAHVVYTAWDAQHCATLSPTIISDVIRGSIGFEGLLMSDDIGMQALKGDMATRARAVLEAGCDIALHCSGDLAQMQAIAQACPPITLEAQARLAQACQAIGKKVDFDVEAARAERDALLAALQG
jgi:beta-N-acetylhexosaminidase